MLKQMPLIRFFEDLKKHDVELFDNEAEPPFTLILGAGASRSAGIPVTCEMIELLQSQIKLRWPDVESFESIPSDFSDLVTMIYKLTNDEWSIQEFFRRCVRRGSREPNLSHFIAANLACARVFRPIVTTNFDDLALAAFWDLPPNEAYEEPYVVYDPRMVRLTQICLGDETPIIIKAHGHHNQYGMGIIERQIRELAPFVKRIIRSFDAPRVGYIVVGCSGAWPDGIMDTLKDQRWTRGKIIYWFYRGKKLPDLHQCRPLTEVVENSDVRFIRCDDSDYLFLKLRAWFTHTLKGSAWLLDERDLFTPPRVGGDVRSAANKANARWWKQTRRRHRVYFRPQILEGVPPDETYVFGTRSEYRSDLGIPDLRRKLLPLLLEIDKWDKDISMPSECLPGDLRSKVLLAGGIEDFPAFWALREATPPRMVWTRRNRQLLKIALAPHTDPRLSYELLHAIDYLGKA